MNRSFTIPHSTFATGFANAAKVVKTKNTLPILDTAFLSVDNGKLRIIATDLETIIITEVPTELEDGDLTCLPVHTINKWLGALPGEDIVFKMDKKAVLKSGGSKLTVSFWDPQEFPYSSATFDSSVEFTKVPELRTALQQVANASSTDEGRPILCSVHMKTENGQMVVEAADGFRMGRTTVKCDGLDLEAVVPIKSINLVSSLTDTLEIGKTQKAKVAFRSGNVTLFSSLIEGRYPDLGQLVPAKSNVKIVADTKHLLLALKQIAVGSEMSIARIDVASDTMKLSTSYEGGEVAAQSDIPVKADGEIMFGVNIVFLNNAIQAVKGDTVNINLNSRNEPILLKKDNLTYLVMPMAVQE